MKTIKIKFNGKGHKVSYKVETIDLALPDIPFMNVYSVFVDDPELQPLLGEHFSMLQNPTQNILPHYNITSSGNVEEINLKKTIAQQIINNPTE